MTHASSDPSEHPSRRRYAHGSNARRAYARFLATLGVSLLTMYALAFSQIDQWAHFHFSVSVLWISLSMVRAMGAIMLVAMRAMLPNPRINRLLLIAFLLILLSAFGAGRLEAGVNDDAFLRSMIPHHSRAIHMCQEAQLADPEVITLCGQIIQTQREEIAQMDEIIARRGGPVI